MNASEARWANTFSEMSPPSHEGFAPPTVVARVGVTGIMDLSVMSAMFVPMTKSVPEKEKYM